MIGDKSTIEARRLRRRHRLSAVATLFVALAGPSAMAQTDHAETSEQKLQRLSAEVLQVQTQMNAYQQQLGDLQQQLADLQAQVSAERAAQLQTADAPLLPPPPSDPSVPGSAATPLGEIRERQAIQESQIATHEVTKVETDSKFPLKLTGLVLFNAFVNTRRVDIPPDPTYALPGGGATGLSLRQTVLGFDARGPHLLGATSQADARVDFFGNTGTQNGYAGSGLIRLRTAHASLKWTNTQAFFKLDRSIIAPNEASSLVAVAQPVFAWSGDLWAWNPQIGLSHSFTVSDASSVVLEAALIDVGDPRLPNATAALSSVTLAERSRWPGTEARVSWVRGSSTDGLAIGLGGYYSPHKTTDGVRFDAWASTVDARIPAGKHVQLLASGYRGMALGGLGAGGYVDYFYQYAGTTESTRPLDAVGGWTQLKIKPGERLEFNGGFGIDNPFAKEIHWSAVPVGATGYTGIAKNRQAFGNFIYSPSSYLLFSMEYRRLWSNYASGPTYSSDAIGLGAGYRF